jgi:hypothetical protein
MCDGFDKTTLIHKQATNLINSNRKLKLNILNPKLIRLNKKSKVRRGFKTLFQGLHLLSALIEFTPIPTQVRGKYNWLKRGPNFLIEYYFSSVSRISRFIKRKFSPAFNSQTSNRIHHNGNSQIPTPNLRNYHTKSGRPDHFTSLIFFNTLQATVEFSSYNLIRLPPR